MSRKRSRPEESANPPEDQPVSESESDDSADSPTLRQFLLGLTVVDLRTSLEANNIRELGQLTKTKLINQIVRFATDGIFANCPECTGRLRIRLPSDVSKGVIGSANPHYPIVCPGRRVVIGSKYTRFRSEHHGCSYASASCDIKKYRLPKGCQAVKSSIAKIPAFDKAAAKEFELSKKRKAEEAKKTPEEEKAETRAALLARYSELVEWRILPHLYKAKICFMGTVDVHYLVAKVMKNPDLLCETVKHVSSETALIVYGASYKNEWGNVCGPGSQKFKEAKGRGIPCLTGPEFLQLVESARENQQRDQEEEMARFSGKSRDQTMEISASGGSSVFAPPSRWQAWTRDILLYIAGFFVPKTLDSSHECKSAIRNLLAIASVNRAWRSDCRTLARSRVLLGPAPNQSPELQLPLHNEIRHLFINIYRSDTWASLKLEARDWNRLISCCPKLEHLSVIDSRHGVSSFERSTHWSSFIDFKPLAATLRSLEIIIPPTLPFKEFLASSSLHACRALRSLVVSSYIMDLNQLTCHHFPLLQTLRIPCRNGVQGFIPSNGQMDYFSQLREFECLDGVNNQLIAELARAPHLESLTLQTRIFHNQLGLDFSPLYDKRSLTKINFHYFTSNERNLIDRLPGLRQIIISSDYSGHFNPGEFFNALSENTQYPLQDRPLESIEIIETSKYNCSHFSSFTAEILQFLLSSPPSFNRLNLSSVILQPNANGFNKFYLQCVDIEKGGEFRGAAESIEGTVELLEDSKDFSDLPSHLKNPPKKKSDLPRWNQRVSDWRAEQRRLRAIPGKQRLIEWLIKQEQK